MKQSAGILLYRVKNGEAEVLLTHPGGPFWGKKDVWSIPKGEVDEGEDLLAAAGREFGEETGFAVPDGELIELGSAKQNSSKINHIWAVVGDADPSKFVCRSTFEMEWPPHSGTRQNFVENDRAAWFSPPVARQKLFKNQAVFIDRLAKHLSQNLDDPTPVQPTLF